MIVLLEKLSQSLQIQSLSIQFVLRISPTAVAAPLLSNLLVPFLEQKLVVVEQTVVQLHESPRLLDPNHSRQIEKAM